MKYPKRSQYKYAKSRYRVRNWSEYEAGLWRRGDLTVWLSDDALDAWQVPAEGKPGGQRTYSDVAIEAALTIRMVFHLPLRQTEGFLRCLAELLKIDLPVPDHTTLSRRLRNLGEIRFRRIPTDRPIHILIDSTGLRIHVGHLRKPPKRRAWRKLHLAVDADTGEILASDLTARRKHDCARVPALLGQIADPVASVSADGAYDTKAVYSAAQERGEGRAVRVLIPPGRDASSVKTPSAGIVGDLFVSHGGIDVLDLTPAGRGTTMRDTSCPVGIRSRHLGHDPERPAPMGPVSGTSHEPELRGESVIVVEPTKHWASHQLDRAFST